MRYLKRTSLFTLFILWAASIAFSQSTSQESKQGTGVISGRVTMGGTAARGVTVIAMPKEDDNPRKVLERMTSGFADRMMKVKTDEEGNFRFTDLIATSYSVFVQAPAMVGVKSSTQSSEQKVETAKKPPTIAKSDADEEDDDDEETAKKMQQMAMDSPMRQIELADDQTVENISFSLARGGVITGRVTYSDGRPVIGESVFVSPTRGNTNNTNYQLGMNSAEGFTTDDRGIYRIYGLTDGRYKISVDVRGTASFAGLTNSALHKRTYYPDVTDEAVATTVDVSSGGEVRNIDIKIGVAGKSYVVTGRVIEADTGKPVPNVSVVFEKARNRSAEGGNSNGMTQANTKGEFRLENVTTGAYVAYSLDGFLKQSDFYGEPLKFEVKDGNLSGIVLKLRRGAIISGLVTLDGVNSPETQAKLAQQTLAAISMDENKMNARDDNNEDDDGMDGFSIAQSPISADGSFMLKGLRAGKVQIGLGMILADSPFAIMRVERSGVEQPSVLTIKPNETISDVHIIIAQKNCTLRGQIAVEGTLPKNARLQVSFSRITHNEQQGFPNMFENFKNIYTHVDAKGEFKFEGLIPGEYQVTLIIGGPLDLDDDPRPPAVQQNVTVTSDREAEVTLVLVWKTRSK